MSLFLLIIVFEEIIINRVYLIHLMLQIVIGFMQPELMLCPWEFFLGYFMIVKYLIEF